MSLNCLHHFTPDLQRQKVKQ